MPPMAAPLPGARLARRGSDRPRADLHLGRRPACPALFCSTVAGASIAIGRHGAEARAPGRGSARPGRCRCAPGSRRPAGQRRCRPCRSSRPCRRGAGRSAGALLAAEAQPAVEQAVGTNHLKPTGTSTSLRPSLAATRSMRRLLTRVLPTAAPALQPGRCGTGSGSPPPGSGWGSSARSSASRCRAGRVGVVAEGDVELVLEPDQARHRVGRGRSPSGSCRPSRGS